MILTEFRESFRDLYSPFVCNEVDPGEVLLRDKTIRARKPRLDSNFEISGRGVIPGIRCGPYLRIAKQWGKLFHPRGVWRLSSGALRSGNGDGISLSLFAPAPGHLL